MISLPLVLGAAVTGVGLGVAGFALVARWGNGPVDRRLATYFGEVTGRTEASGWRGTAVTVAQVVVPGDLEARLGRRLAGAGMAVRPAEWVLLQAGIAVALGLAGAAVAGPALLVLLLVVGAIGPLLYLRIRHARRLAAFGAQLPDTLTMLAGSLAAGLAVPQAIDTVVRDGQEPVAGEFRRVLVEQRLGVEITDALDGIAARMGSVDFGWVVMAIRIQREVGGNLSEVLQTVAETLRERDFVRRQVRTLSAEGRLSAYILGGLPVAMFGYLMVANREFVRPFYTELVGVLMLAAAVGLVAVGGWLMSRMVRIEV